MGVSDRDRDCSAWRDYFKHENRELRRFEDEHRTKVLTYDWAGNTDLPMSAPHLKDAAVATDVRMLMRGQLDHEGVCISARDRIMALSKEVVRLRALVDKLI